MSAVQAAVALVFVALSMVCGAPKAPSAEEAARPVPIQVVAGPAVDVVRAKPAVQGGQCATVRDEACPLRRARLARVEL
jgi:hypothetical protein